MQLAELSRRGDVPISTIKFYLRSGLLPPGSSQGTGRATYSDQHLARLRLIRALVEVGGMTLDRAHAVVVAAEAGETVSDAVTAAHEQLAPPSTHAPSAASQDSVARLIRARGWSVSPTSGHALMLATTLDTLSTAGHQLPAQWLDRYAAAADAVTQCAIPHAAQTPAESSVAGPGARVASQSPAVLTRALLSEAVFIHMHRLAHLHRVRTATQSPPGGPRTEATPVSVEHAAPPPSATAIDGPTRHE